MALDANRRLLLSLVDSEFFDDEKELAVFQYVSRKRKRKLEFLLGDDERERHVRPPLYAETWVTRYSQFNFYRLFRMIPDTFDLLLGVVAPNYEPKLRRGDGQIVDAKKALLMCIFYLAHKDTYVEIADRFNVAESTSVYEVEYILHILVGLRLQYICWPKETFCNGIAQQFQDRAGFPGVIGAIDGSHIQLSPPQNQQLSYINRKMSHSIVLQGICTASKLFTDILVGVPGRRHDSAVFKMCTLYKYCKEYGSHSRFFDRFHILGDSAYPCLSWLLPPFKKPANGDLGASQRRYNYCHSATRTVIENAFALLKGRWARLKYVYVRDVGKVSDIVVAACVLHNFCIMNHDADWTELFEENDRIRMNPQLIDMNYDEVESINGQVKRDEIMRLL